MTSSKAPKETPPFVRVWEILQNVPRGKVVTYGQLSQMIDRRLTPVGIGWAIRAAPPDIGLPWQRVVNAQGGISTDGEHPGLQRTILEKEGVRFERDGHIDLDRYGWIPRDAPRKAAKRAKSVKRAKKSSKRRSPTA